MSTTPFEDIEADLRKLPPAVLTTLRGSVTQMEPIFNEDELTLWAREGLSIANQTVRSWEASVEYFRVGPEVARALPFASFMQWARSGTYLAQESPTLAAAYFRASPGVVTSLRPQYIPRWAGLGRSLYKGTWKSSTLAARFFEVSPELVQTLPFWDVEVFASLIEALSHKSYDVAGECLNLGKGVLSRMGREREAFLSMMRALADGGWREVKGCLEVAPRALPAVEDTQRGRFLRLGERLARGGLRDTPAFLMEGSQALRKVEVSSQRYILDLSEALLSISPEAVPAFLRSLDSVMNRITLNQLDVWFQRGARILRENPEGGLAYFRVESNTSEQVLETLSSSLELDRVRGIMRLYCRALTGEPIEILNTKELVRKGIGWVSESQASTEGTKVYLPELVDQYPDKRENFDWFKVVSTHQVAHLEFNSFGFMFERPAILFPDLRLRRADQRQNQIAQAVQEAEALQGAENGDRGSAERGWLTDMGRFFSLFDERRLALDIFTILEDGRLDHRVKTDYPGIGRAYRRVQSESLSGRPPMEEMPLRQAMVELLVRLSLEQRKDLRLPKDYVAAARMLARVLKRLQNVAATVEDSSEATLRAYDIIIRIPNEEQDPNDTESQDLDDEGEFDEDELQQLLQQMGEPGGQGEEGSEEGGEEDYQSPQEVEFRGDFKPELVQMLNQLRASRNAQDDANGQPISKEMLEELLRQSAEMEMDAESGQIQQSMGMFAQNLMKEAGVPPPSNQPGQGYGPIMHEDEQGGSLEAREPRTYTYDEWDFRAGDYKPKWCIVREKALESGDMQFFNDASSNYATLGAEIRRQFELVIPESFRKVKRVIDGEDLDLDAAIEATIEWRSGLTPSDKVWWRRSKMQRDVAVVFLVDMSASTAEAIEEGRQAVDDQSAPDDPVEYMMWLRTRREGLVRHHHKRIIDLEKESMVLLINALENIGDMYGIYGFSGYGRENVEFYVIKGIDETFGDHTKRHVDKITPMHATRMGPAIRHATHILDSKDAKTKVLFLLSDGRPQDRGYSREGVEKEYAVHDTHMALVEARRKAIIPFCLTVDKAGHDYLKTMCGDMNYEVLDNIWNLPSRLPQLYKRLTL